VHTTTYLPDGIPTDKEERELFFAEGFVERFNEQLPLGQDVTIDDFQQNDTGSLDFDIACSAATYLELAAIVPLSEVFGREIQAGDTITVYQLAEWIYEKLICGKSEKYSIADKTILLLYPENWQFILSDSIVECTRSLCRERGVAFRAVFMIMHSPMGFRLYAPVAPWEETIRASEEFKANTVQNLR